MKNQKVWGIISLFAVLLGGITFLFSHKENPTYKNDVIKNGAKSSKKIDIAKEESMEASLQEEDSIIRETSSSQTEFSKNSEEVKSEKSEEVESTKPNPPISQETIDRLIREQNKIGEVHKLEITQQVQRSWNTCAPTTVSMMLASQGIDITQEQLANEMGTDTTFGTHNTDAIKILNRHLFGYDTPNPNQAGYRLATVTTDNINYEQMRLFKERLKKNIADGYPMYYTFDNARIYSGNSSGEHNVIGTGYQLTDDGSDIACIYYIDPSYVQQDSTHGGLKKITPQELFTAMLTCVEPNYAW